MSQPVRLEHARDIALRLGWAMSRPVRLEHARDIALRLGGTWKVAAWEVEAWGKSLVKVSQISPHTLVF